MDVLEEKFDEKRGTEVLTVARFKFLNFHESPGTSLEKFLGFRIVSGI